MRWRCSHRQQRWHGCGKNGIGGGSSTDWDNEDHDADGNRRRKTLSSSSGDGGRNDDDGGRKGGQGDGEATAGQRQGDGDAKAIGYGASTDELVEFISRNRTEGAMLPMDVDPPRFDSRHRIFRGHLEVGRQLADGILPPGVRPSKTFMTVP